MLPILGFEPSPSCVIGSPYARWRVRVVCWEGRTIREVFSHTSIDLPGVFLWLLCLPLVLIPLGRMGRRDKLHNIMRLRGMAEVSGTRKWGQALQKWAKNVSSSYVNEIPKHFFMGANWQAQSSALLLPWCSTLLVADRGDYCCAEHAVPGSATQSLKPATLPLECLVCVQRSSQPGSDWSHT